MVTSNGNLSTVLQKARDLFRKGAPEKAAEILWGGLSDTPHDLQGWAMLSDLELGLGRIEKAVVAARRARNLAPGDPAVLFALASALRAQGENDEAIDLLIALTRDIPQSLAVWNNLGNAQSDMGCFDDAEKSYSKALTIDPTFADARVNLGLMWATLGRHGDAESAFAETLRHNPSNVSARLNLGGLALRAGDKQTALDHFTQVLRQVPNHGGALYNQGCVLAQLGRYKEAEVALRQALLVNPDDSDAEAQLYHVLQKICDWDALGEVEVSLEAATSHALAAGRRPGETPFMSIARSPDPVRNFKVAAAWSAEMVDRLSPLKVPQKAKNTQKTGPLKIGYLSGNFYDHPTAHNTAGLFARHDREKFEVYAYSFGPDDGSFHRRLIEDESDCFIDLSSLGDVEAAEKIRQHGIDVLVALTGHTEGSRLEICALRPAPIQVGYLTFPGTCGGDFLDYILVDRCVCPPNEAPFYSEVPAYLQGTYWPTDNRQKIASLPSRASEGLPDQAFVFCCFNQTYKIDREIFTRWMSLLRQVPHGVLWLFRSNSQAEENLRKEAERVGVDAGRLIFADKRPKPDHLARMSLADLMLDTRVYTGHTTTADALWAGVPVVAMEGEHFASRVSASLLAAHGMDDLIAPDLENYETLALALAKDPVRLADIRRRIAANKERERLFDTEAKVADLEYLFGAMWQRHCQGLPPHPLGRETDG